MPESLEIQQYSEAFKPYFINFYFTKLSPEFDEFE